MNYWCMLVRRGHCLAPHPGPDWTCRQCRAVGLDDWYTHTHIYTQHTLAVRCGAFPVKVHGICSVPGMGAKFCNQHVDVCLHVCLHISFVDDVRSSHTMALIQFMCSTYSQCLQQRQSQLPTIAVLKLHFQITLSDSWFWIFKRKAVIF